MKMYRLAGTVSKAPGIFSLGQNCEMATFRFYVRATNEAEAGARIHDLFRELGYAFGDYTVIPTVISCDDDCPSEDIQLLREAEASGEALRLVRSESEAEE